jgi:carboxyl-terminal processing protease
VKTLEQQTNEEQQQDVKPAGKFIRIKPFALIMLMFLTILVTAGITVFALTFGDKKVVEVAVPVERSEFKSLYEAYDQLNEKYYTDLDSDVLVKGAINGMFDSIEDPYTDYQDVEEATSFNESLSSSFEGIGAEIQERNGYIMVVSPIKNSPAEKAGLLPQDLILSVDGESLKGMSANEAVLLIRGEKGTSVKLSVQRGEDSEPFDISIKRDIIPIETVYGELDEDKIAHIQITTFSETTQDELTKLLADYETQGMKGVIIDVRQNPGGSLLTVIEIANLFLDEGKTILQVQGKTGEPEVYKAEGGKKYDVPLTVLIDEGSASASEILAAAIIENKRGEVIGVNSFGKGTVQTVETLRDGSNLKYTNAKWLTPKGNWINEKGVAPTVEVKYPEYMKLTYIDSKKQYKEGSAGAAVKSAKGMLEVLGYEVGEVNETFDASLTNAVKQFQSENKLEVSGVLTGDTTFMLMEKMQEYIEANDPMEAKAKELLTKKSK